MTNNVLGYDFGVENSQGFSILEISRFKVSVFRLSTDLCNSEWILACAELVEA